MERPCPAVRDRLLNVALQLFAQKGFESTSVREIASAAEVTKPTIYYYFKNKETLYGAALDEAFGELFARLHEVLDRGLPPREKILTYVSTYFDFLAANPATSADWSAATACEGGASSGVMVSLRLGAPGSSNQPPSLRTFPLLIPQDA